MKIQIEIDENLTEEEVIIRCRQLDDAALRIQAAVKEASICSKGLVFYKGNTEYYMPLEKVIFFETENGIVNAHTAKEMFEARYKLYELEDILPGHFMRISKSAIINTDHIYAINRNLTAASAVEFTDSHKQVFVSRSYYKALREKLEEKRMRL